MDGASTHIDFIAIFFAAFSAFVLGGLWYGPLFGKVWQYHVGISEEALSERNMPLVFGGAFLLMLLAAVDLALFIGPQATLRFGAMAGLAAGVGWFATLLGVTYLFERRSLSLWLVNGAYGALALTIMGAILGSH
ncbi:MAG: DUF1761 domain-containing protein [Myxococcota bacterium]